jgi:ABC-2 type transport system permease protein
MRRSLAKYWYVVNIGLQNTFVYRWNFLLRILFGMIPLMGTFFLWGAVFHGSSQQMAGYGFREMISYFLVLVLLDSLASPTEDDFQIAGEIRDGLINQFLLKPIDYLGYRFSLFWSYRFIYTTTTIVPVLLVFVFMRDYLVVSGSVESWILASIAVLGSATLQFLMAYCTALLAFWILDVAAPIFIFYSFEYLAGGHVFPLDLLPKKIYQIAMWTPFPYEYWFPLGVFLGRLSPNEVAMGFARQFFWIAMFFVIGRWIWNRGIRHYTAVGG